MTPLLVVTAYCSKDRALAAKLMEWISELTIADRAALHCLLVSDASVSVDEKKEMGALAKRTFGTVMMVDAVVPGGHAPNHMFLAAAQWIFQCCKLPWLWLEPDAVPLTPTWVDDLSEQYADIPFKFMGPVIRSNQPGIPSLHMTGTAIYPQDAWLVYQGMERLKTDNVAWDIESAGAVMPRTGNTHLIHHFWGERDLPPHFVQTLSANKAENDVDLSFIRAGAVLFHRCKDGSLIDLLRQKCAPQSTQDGSVVKAVTKPEPVKRGPGRPPKVAATV